MNNNSSASVIHPKAEAIKKFVILATIVIATICALLAIIAIFVGAEPALLNIICTLLILYLAMVYSTKNISHLDDRLPVVRLLSGIALLANIFWSIFWILLVWDAFGALSVDTRDTIWRLVGSAAVISVMCSVLAFSIARVFSVHYPTIITVYKSLPLVCAGFFGVDILLVIWLPRADTDLLGKFFLAECILLLLQWIVTRILISNAGRLNIDMGIYGARPSQTNNTAQTGMQPDQASANAASQAVASVPQNGGSVVLKILLALGILWLVGLICNVIIQLMI